MDNTAKMAWKDLKQKVNVQYYIGGPRFGALDKAIGEPDTEPTAKPKAEKPAEKPAKKAAASKAKSED